MNEYAENCKAQIKLEATGSPTAFAEDLSKRWTDEIAKSTETGLLEQTDADELMEVIREKMQEILGIPEWNM